MTTRRAFLTRFFRLLEERGLRYCVLRNFPAVFTAGRSDIDVLACSRDVRAIRAVADEAAAAEGWRLVQVARFVNHSWVFWNGDAEFVRLDLDTEIRWRCFHACDAGSVLAARIDGGDFFIPAPADEVRIIAAQIAWYPPAAANYAARLRELGVEPIDGRVARRRILLDVLQRPARWLTAGVYFARDMGRWLARQAAPPGISLHVESAAEFSPEAVAQPLAQLFPPMKVATCATAQCVQRTIFRAGLALVLRRVSRDAELTARKPSAAWPPLAAADLPRLMNPGFAAMREASGAIHAAHYGTGAMSRVNDEAGLARFLTESLARVFSPRKPRGRGVWLVLAGLDGSGKTTFARELCAESARRGVFGGTRYFHFVPRAKGVEFPWPVFADVPRKSPPRGGMIGHVLSAARLVRNVALARWRHEYRVKPLLERGWLVVIDRFLLNYWLDPASVRYSGPESWLDRAAALLPRADLLVVLNAPAEVLLARKQELSLAEIARQAARLRELPQIARQRLDLDATLPPGELARITLERAEAIAGSC